VHSNSKNAKIRKRKRTEKEKETCFKTQGRSYVSSAGRWGRIVFGLRKDNLVQVKTHIISRKKINTRK